MKEVLLKAFCRVQTGLSTLVRNERGDQNIGNLGLIVVTMLIVAFLVKTFIPAVEEIFNGVIGKMKEYLKVT